MVTGANVFVPETHAIDTSTVTTTIGAGGTLGLTASSIALTTALVNDPTATVVLTATSGGITGTTGSISAANVTLNSAAGINVANVTAAANLSMTAVGANFNFTEGSGTMDLVVTHVTDTAGQAVTLNSPTFATSAAFTVTGLDLVLNATQPGGTTTVTNNISAHSISLISDNLTVGGGATLLADAASGTLEIQPFTAGARDAVLGESGGRGDERGSGPLLAVSTGQTAVLGGTGMSGAISVDAADLSTRTFGLTLQTTGAVSFINGGTLTLANNKTFTVIGASGVSAGSSNPAIVIGGGAGTIDFVSINGDIGSHATPLSTQVSVLAGVSGTGTVYLSNTGGLTVSGVVNPGGGNGDGFISAHSPLTVSADITVAGGFTLSADTGDLTIDSAATVSSTTGGTINLVVTTTGNIVINNGHVTSTNGGANLSSAGNITISSGSVAAGSGAMVMGSGLDISLTNANVTSGTANLTAFRSLLITTSAVTGTNVLMTATTGDITLGGSDVTSTAGNVGLTSTSGNLSVTNSNVTSTNGNVGLTATSGNISLSGSTVTSTNGSVVLTTTTGNITVGSSNVTSTNGNVGLAASTTITPTNSNVTLGTGTANFTTAGDVTLNGSTVSATGGTIDLTSTAGNVTLNTGNLLTGSGSVALNAGGAVTMIGTASQLTAGALVAHSGTGVTLDSNLITVGSILGSVTGAGDVVFVDQSGAVITGITTAGGNVSILANGNVTQGAFGIVTGGGNLSVQTRSAGGTAGTIVLTNAGNNLGVGLATLQVRDAGGGTTVSADVQFTTSGPMHLQQVDAGTAGNVTLTGTTINQIVGDAVGIRGAGLTVNSAGNVTLTNLNNVFSTLTVTDTNGVASHLAFETSAAGGLTVAGFSQTTTGGGATASIVNQTGAITSNVALSTADLSLTATGGISLSNTSNFIPAITLTNNGTGAINIQDGTSLVVLGSAQNASNSTTIVSAGNVTVSGAVTGGTTLAITTGTGSTLTTSGASLSATGPITLKADAWVIDPAQTISGTTVTLTSVSAAHHDRARWKHGRGGIVERGTGFGSCDGPGDRGYGVDGRDCVGGVGSELRHERDGAHHPGVGGRNFAGIIEFHNERGGAGVAAAHGNADAGKRDVRRDVYGIGGGRVEARAGRRNCRA